MFVYVVFGALLIGTIIGGIALASAVYRVMSERFDELMPQRMVDFSGFVDLKDNR